MEDAGHIPSIVCTADDLYNYKKKIAEKLADSVVFIGKNQKVDYKEIFIVVKSVVVKAGEIGSALVAAPYITLAQDACKINNGQSLLDIDIEQWSRQVGSQFLDS